MFKLDDDIMQQLRATFKIEAAENIQAMNRVLLALEANPQGDERAALLEEIFREAHSLKGAAGAADFGEVERTAHKLESAFGAAKAGKIKLTTELCDVLYEGIDAVNVIVEAALEERPHGLNLTELYARLDAAELGQVSAQQKPVVLEPASVTPPPAAAARDTSTPQVAPAPQVTSAPQAAPLEEKAAPASTEPIESSVEPEAPLTASESKTKAAKGKPGRSSAVVEETIRVATTKLDSLMTQAGELLVAGLKIDQRLNDVDEIRRTLEEWNREWLKARSANSNLLHEGDHETMRPLIKLLDMSQDRLRALSTQVNDLRRGFSRDALHLARVTNDLGDGVMKVRMLPVSTVFDAFPRLVRDLAHDRGKEVELVMEGGETELDRRVLEEIKDPLIHMLRNSVDHGIEKPAERLKANKPRQGAITLKAFQKGNNIVIQVADDGAGINRQKVKQAALKAGLISVDTMETMSDDEALRLIFASGLSTSAMITDISGRGVGMDVVHKNVEALQGQVDIESVPGQGTTFTLILPLTLATTQELLVQVNDQTYGIPISSVERILRIMQKDIATVQGHPAIVVDSEPVSLVKLVNVLEMPERASTTGANEKIPVVILSSAKRRIAFMVDAVVGQQETVVKSLGRQLARVRNVAGATILGTGQVIMTLNPSDLLKSARGADGRSAAAPASKVTAHKATKRPTVLVVDDSLSTRTLEKNILETAGYHVMLAIDGAEALSVLNASSGCDLILSDVLMPHMSGFDLTAAIKANPKTKKIPVVLVTSLDSRADKEHGIEVGADAYLVKSNFDQAGLLKTLEQLI